MHDAVGPEFRNIHGGNPTVPVVLGQPDIPGLYGDLEVYLPRFRLFGGRVVKAGEGTEYLVYLQTGFFLKLPYGALFNRLAGVDSSAGKLPLSGEGIIMRYAPHDQNSIVFDHGNTGGKMSYAVCRSLLTNRIFINHASIIADARKMKSPLGEDCRD